MLVKIPIFNLYTRDDLLKLAYIFYYTQLKYKINSILFEFRFRNNNYVEVVDHWARFDLNRLRDVIYNTTEEYAKDSEYSIEFTDNPKDLKSY